MSECKEKKEDEGKKWGGKGETKETRIKQIREIIEKKKWKSVNVILNEWKENNKVEREGGKVETKVRVKFRLNELKKK